jgi:hypothetical protein
MQTLIGWFLRFFSRPFPTIEYEKDEQKELMRSLTEIMRQGVSAAGMDHKLKVVPYFLHSLKSFGVKVRQNSSVREDQPGGRTILVLEVNLPEKQFLVISFENGVQGGAIECESADELKIAARAALRYRLAVRNIGDYRKVAGG